MNAVQPVGGPGPRVSVLIPAYKPEYLQTAIASALTQTYTDLEVLVGDDNPDDRLRGLVEAFTDPRVRYIHHGFGDAELNLRGLWNQASGEYIKPLFDDDFLTEESVEVLVGALDAVPEAALAFHERVFVDADSRVTEAPPPLLPEGEASTLTRDFLAATLAAGLRNFVGEPSNTMLRRSLVDIDTVYTYRGFKLDYLADVASYLNLSGDAPIVAVGGHYSAFRVHGGQASNPSSPRYSAGLFEWELMVRGEAALGFLSREDLERAHAGLSVWYRRHVDRYPELAALAAGLDELRTGDPAGLFDSRTFQANLAAARLAVAERIANPPRPEHCVVCSTDVGAFRPHPNADKVDLRFMYDMGVVGSRLDKHLCPNCACNDRDRHLWMYLAAVGALTDLPGQRVLHIAPEARLEPMIAALGPAEYVCGDLFPRPGHLKIDVEQLQFPDGHFDLIICNHVLEHVHAPDRAVAEFARVLAPGGRLVAQTPYSPLLRNTIEMTRPVSAEFATYYFGQNDHVRLFGADIVDVFHRAGLHGDLYAHDQVVPGVDPDDHGVNADEPFFVFSNDPAKLPGRVLATAGATA